MILTTKQGDFTVEYDTDNKNYQLKDSNGDVLKDSEDIDAIIKRIERSLKKEFKRVEVLVGATFDNGTVTSTAENTNYRGQLYWVIRKRGRSKESGRILFVITPENLALIEKYKEKQKLIDDITVEKNNIFNSLKTITPDMIQE